MGSSCMIRLCGGIGRSLVICYMSGSARKPTLWTLRKVSTRISISTPHKLTRTDMFRLLWIFRLRNHYSIYLYPPETECVGIISLPGMRRLIWVDTLRRVHNVDFLMERLIWCLILLSTNFHLYHGCFHISFTGQFIYQRVSRISNPTP